ncbi:MAG: calcium-binding protein [Paracoccaceae bacterium]|nr:calcium-binding protein [Paracoccaceae bacterium]
MELGLLIFLIAGGAALSAIFDNDNDSSDDSSSAEEAGLSLTGIPGKSVVEGGDGDDTIVGLDQYHFLEGGDGNDVIEANNSGYYGYHHGGSGDDVLTNNGTGPYAHMYGGDGADTLTGGTNSDYLYAGGGANTSEVWLSGIHGSHADDGAADSLDGGDGNDYLNFNSGDTATGGNGTDNFRLWDLEAAFDADNPATITDWTSGEVLQIFGEASTATFALRTDGDDAIVTFDDQDIIVVQGAATTLTLADIGYFGGYNFDEPDTFTDGTDGDDSLVGTSGYNYVHAGDGNDTIEVGGGFDYVFAGDGDDTITMDRGRAYGGDGADTITGGDNSDVINAAGGESFWSNEYGDYGREIDDDGDADVINAGDGGDVIIFSGTDTVTGGGGTDYYSIDVDGVVDAGATAVLTDYESGETVELFADETLGTVSAVAVRDDGGNAIVSIDGVDVLIAQGAAGTLTTGNITLRVY